MQSRDIRLKVREFQKKYGIHSASGEELEAAVEKLGYTVVAYSNVYNEEPVSTLIRALKVSEQVKRSRAFTYEDANQRIIFIHEDLVESEKRIVLAHELGHICLGHMAKATVIGRDVQEEFEANEFAHYLLYESASTKTGAWIRAHLKWCIIGAAAVVLAAGLTVFFVIHHQNSYYGEYYVTETGTKFHLADCICLVNRKNVRRLTNKEYESGEYEACGVCMPDGEVTDGQN